MQIIATSCEEALSIGPRTGGSTRCRRCYYTSTGEVVITAGDEFGYGLHWKPTSGVWRVIMSDLGELDRYKETRLSLPGVSAYMAASGFQVTDTVTDAASGYTLGTSQSQGVSRVTRVSATAGPLP